MFQRPTSAIPIEAISIHMTPFTGLNSNQTNTYVTLTAGVSTPSWSSVEGEPKQNRPIWGLP